MFLIEAGEVSEARWMASPSACLQNSLKSIMPTGHNAIMLVGLCRYQPLPCELDKFLKRQEHRRSRYKVLMVIGWSVYLMVIPHPRS